MSKQKKIQPQYLDNGGFSNINSVLDNISFGQDDFVPIDPRISKFSKEGKFISPYIHTPEIGQPRKREADPIIKGITKGFSEPILGIKQELESAGDNFKQGKIGKIAEGGVDVLKGLIHTAMTPFTVPYGAITQGIKGTGKVGEQMVQGLDQVMNLPFDVIKGGSELTAQGLNLIGIDTKEISSWLGISPELDKKADELVTEIGGLAMLMKSHKSARDYVDKTAGKKITEFTEPEFVIRPSETKPQDGLTQEKLPTELIEKPIEQKIVDVQQKVQQIRQEVEVKKKSVREERRTKILEDNKTAINQILNESPELSSPSGIRTLSKKLNSLVTQGKLSDKVDSETIRVIAEEWSKNRKVGVQKVKSTGDEIKVNLYNDRNISVPLKQITDKYPEIKDLIPKQKEGQTWEDYSAEASSIAYKEFWKRERPGKTNESNVTKAGEEGITLPEIKSKVESKGLRLDGDKISPQKIGENGEPKNYVSVSTPDNKVTRLIEVSKLDEGLAKFPKQKKVVEPTKVEKPIKESKVDLDEPLTEIKEVPIDQLRGREFEKDWVTKEETVEPSKRDYIDKYTEAYKKGEIVEPIKAFAPRPGKNEPYDVYDGHRRILAAKKAGLKTLPVEVVLTDKNGLALTQRKLNEQSIKETKTVEKPEIKSEELKDQQLQKDLDDIFGTKLADINKKIESKKRELKKKNIENLGRTNIGIDPESLKLVSEMIGLYAEKGIIKLEQVTAEAVKDLGEWVKPYVKKAWDERTTSIKNAKVTEERGTRGLPELTVPEVRSWEKVNKEAKDLIDKGFDVDKLAEELANNPRPLTDTEVSLLTFNREKIKQERNRVNEELANITDESKRAEKLKQSLELDEKFNLNDLASKQSKTESARGLGIARMEIKDDYSIAPLMQRARTANNNAVVPDEIRIKLEDYSRKITEAEKKVQEYQERVSKLEADKIIRDLESQTKFEQRTTRRARKKQELETEYQDLLKEFAKTTQFNALVDPRQIAVLSKIAKNRVENGITSVEQMADGIYQDIKKFVPDISKQDIIDAIGGMGRFKKMTDGEIKFELNKIKRQVSDETLQKTYKTRLENRKAELEKMLETGNFEKTPRRKTKMNEELSRLKDEVDLLKIKADKEVRLLELKNRTTEEKVKDWTIELTNIPRTLMASVDLSAPLRQGIVYSFAHPLIAFGKGGAFREMFKYFGSDKALRELRREIEDSPNAFLYNKSGLYLANEKSNLHRLSGREEAYMSSLPEKIPGYGRLIRGSERAYTGFLDKMRMDMFDFYVEQARKSGVTFESNPKLYKDMAKVINTSTGRGTLGGFERSATALSVGLFSPRLIASRLQLINPRYYFKLDPFARKMAMKDMLKFVSVGTSLVGLAKLAGAEVETDPRSTDFMKIKIGDTRLDVWGGFQQYGVLITRMISGQTKNAEGKIKELRSDKYPFRNRWDVGLRFAEQKISPFAGFIRDYFKDENFEGNEFNFTDEFIKNITPLYLQDMYDAIQIDGAEGAFKVMPGIFGVGTQTYKPKEKINKYK